MPPIAARFIIQAALLATLLLSIAAPPASAGTMVLYSCHTPSGRIVGTSGWAHSTVATRTEVINDCASGPNGGLYAESRGPHTDRARWGIAWMVNAPPSTSFTAVSGNLCAAIGTGVVTVGWSPTLPFSIVEALKLVPPGFELPSELGCAGVPPYWADSRSAFLKTGLAASRIAVGASCGFGPCDMPYLFATVQLSSIRIEVKDDVAPTVGAVRGALAANTTHQGVEDVVFDVSDAGVGIYRVVAEARTNAVGEWRELASSPIGQKLGSCVALRETAYPYEFDSPSPCPLSLDATRFSFDTAQLPDGTHDFRVAVIDAAGNRTAVIPPRRFHIPRDTPAAPVPSLPQPVLQITGPRQRSRGAARTFALRGKLVDAKGAPLGGVPLTIRTRAYFPKAGVSSGEWSTLGRVTTRANGSYNARVPGGASRSIQISTEGGPGFAAAVSQVDVIAPAKVSARARDSRVRNRRPVRISGRVAGPIPSGGVPVTLEVRQRGRWIPVGTTKRWVRTRPSGTFTLSYRFLRTLRPTTYRFRVVADEDSAFTYSRGVSRAVSVRVGP